MICTFFGHRDVSISVKPVLHKVITELIVDHGVDTFYVGDRGDFDRIVKSELAELKKVYPIKYYIVLAYMPAKDGCIYHDYYDDTIYPDGLENVHPKYAIDKRNRIMIEKADYAVTYVVWNGNAAKYEQIAERKGKVVIKLANMVDKNIP